MSIEKFGLPKDSKNRSKAAAWKLRKMLMDSDKEFLVFPKAFKPEVQEFIKEMDKKELKVRAIIKYK